MENKKDEKDCVECGNETVGYMLQIMGHELRNPTTVVGGLATQLYEKITEEDEGCGYVMSEMDIVKLKIINEEARHALKIMAIFDAFVRKFPDFKSLSSAPFEEVLRYRKLNQLA